MATMSLDESKISDERDLQYLRATRDPEVRQAMYCSLSTYRRPDRLAAGDPVPALTLRALASRETRNLATSNGRPTVLIFGSYT